MLKLPDLKGSTVTIDARGTQKEIALPIREQKGHGVPALKGNQSGLQAATQPLFSEGMETDFVDRKHDVYETTEMRHGRTDERETWESRLDVSSHSLHAETLAAKPQGSFYGKVVDTSSNLALA